MNLPVKVSWRLGKWGEIFLINIAPFSKAPINFNQRPTSTSSKGKTTASDHVDLPVPGAEVKIAINSLKGSHLGLTTVQLDSSSRVGGNLYNSFIDLKKTLIESLHVDLLISPQDRT